MRQSKNFSMLLDSINAAAVGLMAYALYPLGKIAFGNWASIIIFAATAIAVWKFPKLSSVKLVVFGFFAGLLASLVS